MEVLSLLKYLRGNAGACQNFGGGNGIPPDISVTAASALSTPVEEESSDDDGPFFDLEFPVPVDESDSTCFENDFSVPGPRDEPAEEASDDDREFDSACKDLAADDLFVPLESSGTDSQTLPVSLLRTKLRALMLGLKKQKSLAVDPHSTSAPDTIFSPNQVKLSLLNFRVAEAPVVSLFSRDNSSRNGGSDCELAKEQMDNCAEKKPSKELVQKYLSKIKPLYVRSSKRSAEKSKLNSEQVLPDEEKEDEESSSSSPEESSSKTVQKQNQSGAIPTGLRVVRKHLGTSRSTSAPEAKFPSLPPAAPKRQDDSLLQQQDGIQSAIAHCKMSLSVRGDEGASADCSEKAREDFT